MDLIPLYGFLEGDCVGLLILARKQDTIQNLVDKLQHAARMRVATKINARLIHKNKEPDPRLTVMQVGMEALDRFDVVGTAG